MKLCPCGSRHPFMKCCKPFITGKAQPTTPEQLMRSRYVAYTRNNLDYIAQTMSGAAMQNFIIDSAKKRAESIKWLNLTVHEAYDNIVEFTAYYEQDHHKHTLHERSLFEQIDGTWFYIDSLV